MAVVLVLKNRDMHHLNNKIYKLPWEVKPQLSLTPPASIKCRVVFFGPCQLRLESICIEKRKAGARTHRPYQPDRLVDHKLVGNFHDQNTVMRADLGVGYDCAHV